MSQWSPYIIGALIAGFPVFAMRALACLVRSRWTKAALNLGAGALCLLLGVMAIPLIAMQLVRDPHSTDAHAQGRRLAEVAIDLAYDAVWIALLGVPLGLVLAVSLYRRLSPTDE